MVPLRWRIWFTKLVRWEFWPFALVYGPVMPYIFWLICKARSFHFYVASNPGIAYGGFVLESKWDVYCITPPEYQPVTVLIDHTQPIGPAIEAARQIGYPLVAKPEVGGRGKGVAMINNQEELASYHRQIPLNYLLQAKITLPCELGIFYIRLPDAPKGFVSGIVLKEFLQVVGDGHSTVRQLLLPLHRLHVYIPMLELEQPELLEQVPGAGERQVLLPYGNHARGSTFYDASNQISPELVARVDAICQRIPGFYFGRLDLRCDSIDSFAQGGPFRIIEVNGAGAEPTHMYDPRNSIWDAWRELARHWRWCYRVSAINRKRGVPVPDYSTGRKILRQSAEFDRMMDAFVFKPS